LPFAAASREQGFFPRAVFFAAAIRRRCAHACFVLVRLTALCAGWTSATPCRADIAVKLRYLSSSLVLGTREDALAQVGEDE
jgi:hypothetical protein